MGHASEKELNDAVAVKWSSLYIVSALHFHTVYEYCCFIIEEYFHQIGQVWNWKILRNFLSDGVKQTEICLYLSFNNLITWLVIFIILSLRYIQLWGREFSSLVKEERKKI
jgi:hypothetical protein